MRWWRRWMGSRAAGRRPAYFPPDVVSHVQHIPTPYTIHADVVRALKDVDDSFDYFPTPGGRILLLQFQPGKERIETGRKRLMRRYRIRRSLHEAHLMAQGFALEADLEYTSLYTGELVAEAKRVHRVTPEALEAWRVEAIKLADGTAEQEAYARAVRERMQAEGRSDHAILFRHRKHFPQTV